MDSRNCMTTVHDNVVPPATEVALDPIKKTAHAVFGLIRGKSLRKYQGPSTVEIERDLFALEGVVKSIDQAEEFVELLYDIPTRLSESGTVPNPSDTLRWFGVRNTWSTWVLPRYIVDHPTIQGLFRLWEEHSDEVYGRRRGVRYRTVRYHPEEYRAIREIAREHLYDRLTDARLAVETAMDACDEALAEALAELDREEAAGASVSEKDRQRPINKWVTDSRNALRSACEEFESAVQAASIFDASDNVSDAVYALRESIRARAAIFNEIAGIRQVKPAPTVA